MTTKLKSPPTTSEQEMREVILWAERWGWVNKAVGSPYRKEFFSYKWPPAPENILNIIYRVAKKLELEHPNWSSLTAFSDFEKVGISAFQSVEIEQ